MRRGSDFSVFERPAIFRDNYGEMVPLLWIRDANSWRIRPNGLAREMEKKILSEISESFSIPVCHSLFTGELPRMAKNRGGPC
jgi:hypothetical protein